jgi:hypothetical protein
MLIGSVFAGVVLAAPVSTSQAPVRPNPAKSSAPLSEEECSGLGGKIHPSNQCPDTGEICLRADENGVIHRACITIKSGH